MSAAANLDQLPVCGCDAVASKHHPNCPVVTEVVRLLAEARAKAWDEGYRWAFGEGYDDEIRRLGDNPYRAEATS